ncbi:MAG: 50S ribosomal protein L11 [Spirochaetes bacterium]|nr:50S ribosomal protein L11 [Spirochaetota bacterium]
MAKKVTGMVKVRIPAGEATPAPPLGPALGQKQVPIALFCKDFNAKTMKMKGQVLTTIITVYEDKSYTFITKGSPTSMLILKRMKIEKGSSTPNKIKVGTLAKKDLEEIAKEKMEYLSANDIEGAKKIVAGTARSMGVNVEE